MTLLNYLESLINITYIWIWTRIYSIEHVVIILIIKIFIVLEFDHSILRCPITNEDLRLIREKELQEFSTIKDLGFDMAFINNSKTFLFPVIQGIIQLLPFYAVPTSKNGDMLKDMHFDKDRVFRYYNDIKYEQFDTATVYADSKKFVDFREVSRSYLERSLKKSREYISSEGKYFLDIASGPIGLKEYVDLSIGYKYRICIDISFNALLQARQNLQHQKGIFICGDITNIPLKENICDAVVSHHTIYHIPRRQQKIAIEELYRVAKVNSKVAIIYSWFFHSILMNIFLFPIQLYRIIRHYGGKLYVKFFSSKPRLYFYAHSPRWFKKLGYGNRLNIYCWRSVNKQFLQIYIHNNFIGRKLLKSIEKLEDRYPRIMGIIGDYPIIIIDKK